MSETGRWNKYWEDKASLATSDFEFDRGRRPGVSETEALSVEELLCFLEPKASEVVLDAGCGTGAVAELLRPHVRRLVCVDFSDAAVRRCQQRLLSSGHSVMLARADVTRIPLPSSSVDMMLCLSVLQYLSDSDVRLALREAARILRKDGALVLHVKNASSLYLSTLFLAKRLKRRLGRTVRMENVRSYKWYFRELRMIGFDIVAYNSFSTFVVEGMPARLVETLRAFELKYRARFPMNTPFLRRHGAELKIKARLARPSAA